MFYINSAYNNMFSVVDTNDNVSECYTLRQLNSIRKRVRIQGVSADCSDIKVFSLPALFAKSKVLHGEDFSSLCGMIEQNLLRFAKIDTKYINNALYNKHMFGVHISTVGRLNNFARIDYDGLGYSLVEFPNVLESDLKDYYDDCLYMITKDSWNNSFGMSNTNNKCLWQCHGITAAELKCSSYIKLLEIKEATLEDYLIKWILNYEGVLATARFHHNSATEYAKRVNEASLKW